MSPLFAFTQINMTEDEQKMRDLIFQLLDSKNPRNLLEENQWSTQTLMILSQKIIIDIIHIHLKNIILIKFFIFNN